MRSTLHFAAREGHVTHLLVEARDQNAFLGALENRVAVHYDVDDPSARSGGARSTECQAP